MGLTDKLLPDNNCNWVTFQLMGIPRKPVLPATLLKEPYKENMYALSPHPHISLSVK